MRSLACATLLALLTACASAPPPTAPSVLTAAATPATPEAPSAGNRCRVRSAGLPEWQGLCTLEGGKGGFALTPVGTPDFGGGISTVSVTLDGKGAAEVRGLTADGINSRWGVAERSAPDRVCWVGVDFEVCVWAGGLPGPSAEKVDAATKAVDPQAGGKYWVVYLAVSYEGGTPELKAAEATLRARGFKMGGTMSSGQLSCDRGAAAALGRSEDAYAVGAWFASETAALAFSATLPSLAVGVAQVSPGCQD